MTDLKKEIEYRAHLRRNPSIKEMGIHILGGIQRENKTQYTDFLIRMNKIIGLIVF